MSLASNRWSSAIISGRLEFTTEAAQAIAHGESSVNADDLLFCDSASQAPEGADALVVVTESKQFCGPGFARIKAAQADAVEFNGRNLYQSAEIEAADLTYYGIGRGRSLHAQ